MGNDGFKQPFKKEIRTAEQLSHQILTELKTTRFCAGANGVVILPWEGNPAVANWHVNNFDPGASLAIDVEMALLDIVPPMQSRYALAE